MFRSRDSIGRATSSEGSGFRATRRNRAYRTRVGRSPPRLPVGEGVPLRGRAAVAPRRGHHLDAAAGRLDRLAGRPRERVGLHREALRQLTAAEHLHQAALGDEAPGSQGRRADLAARVERLERVQVHHAVLDPKRVGEALGLRRAAVQRRLAALEARLHAGSRTRVLALGTAAGGLAALAADTTRDALGRPARARGRLQIMDLHATSSTLMRWGTLASMPRTTGVSSCSRVVLMPCSPSARSVPRCLGLTPIDDRTWVTFNVIT